MHGGRLQNGKDGKGDGGGVGVGVEAAAMMAMVWRGWSRRW